MTVYIYDTTPKNQTYAPFNDSESVFQKEFNFCGLKKYELSNSITYVTAPTIGQTILDLWTIFAITNDKAQVGIHTVTLTASLISYSSVPAQSVSFKLTVIDNCETATLSSLNEQNNFIEFVPLVASSPSFRYFKPFNDTVAF